MRQRALIVSQEFWPTISDATLRLLQWCVQLEELGCQVTVVTSRPNPNWPVRFAFGSLKVVRMDSFNGSPLRATSWARDLQSWVRSAVKEFDWIYFDELGREAITFLNRADPARTPPVLARFAEDGRSSNHCEKSANEERKPSNWCSGKLGFWGPWRSLDGNGRDPFVAASGGRADAGEQSADNARTNLVSETTRPLSRGALDACRRASLIIVPSATAHQRLLSAGASQVQIVRLADRNVPVIDRSIGARRGARQILSRASHDLMLRSTDRVIVCPGDLTQSRHAGPLIEALGELTEEFSSLRVWILGEGANRSMICRRLKNRGWHYSIVLPGVFTDLEQIFQAADLFLFTEKNVGLSYTLPVCLASRIPALVADSPTARESFLPDFPEMLFDAYQPTVLKQRVAEWLQRPDDLEKLALAVQNRTMDERRRVVDECRRLISRLERQSAGQQIE